MRKTQHIKLFSHNDLDGFGAPCLFYALAPYMFRGVEFDLTTCSAGNLDRELEHWFKEPDILRYTDVYIMDMTPDSDYSFKLLEQKFANHWLIFDHHESEAELRSGYSKNCILPLDENGEPIPARRSRGRNNRNDNRNDRKGGYRNHGNGGNRKRNGNNTHRNREEEIPHKPTNFDDIMSTSFEKDYRKPKPEDDLQVGLYGKIE